ncbi:3'(2'),5'-bisphosphate nucleotidase CysQ [uncultured Bacteroides sp.]|jgi:3'(2'), 5'-bisphosphate nucleotidase|uniref:3'(2'),5'-bisphosphate nucleotidase CysQ n=1 Tax=uncultured Bacteroides sp. TaxID=162156 RepID=UPI00280ACFCC|nr:3'(2'),5'-bisphosphate nucleotidase CysQ [uncultured Bacteroides sp.]
MDKNILYTAICAAVEAGAEIMNVYTDPDADFEIERKADNSPLTVADRKSHQVIAARLASTPYPVLSEEGKAIPAEERLKWKELWVVDPLDGTKEFIKRNGEFTVNIAYVKEGYPEAGVIYIPVKKELYFADCEWGAYKVENITSVEGVTLEQLIRYGHRLPYTNEHAHKAFVIVASRSHLTPETEAYINEMKQKHQQVETVSKGSSLKLCLIAEGKADVYPRFAPTMEWDTAAGHAIIRAAGKEVYQAGSDKPLQYNKTELLNPWFIAK